MAQHATLAPNPHHGGHEPYPTTHALASSHLPPPMASGPLPPHPQQQHQQQAVYPQPPPSNAHAPPRQAEFYPPSSTSFYPPNPHNAPPPPPHHIASHPPSSQQHSAAGPAARGGPMQQIQPSAGPSSMRTSPSAPNTAMDWPPSGGSSQDRRPSMPVGSGHRSQLPSPDPHAARRTSEILMQQQGVRTSDSFLARAANEHLVMHDRPMARRPSDMGGQPEEDDGRVGVEDPYAERSYTELKVLGDGSFGTVWLCDWHSPVKPGVLLSAMQCGAGARPEWAGKRLVALKRMKRVWEGGWRQARNLGELASLRSIPPHPAVIPLYDAFIAPRSRELYFVFECMEGNLYQLTKSRKGRPLAEGLVASCFHQMVSGLRHVHRHGYFHRDMKPENLLVTTTGLCDYLATSAVNEINSRRASGEKDAQLAPNDMRIEKDVQVIIKLADFGLARGINSKPPYTEYVSTRWYRAPEVLLRATDYGAPVDMWALGTILAEMINLKPLFPGVSEIDQVYRICEVLGDPNPEYGPDENGRISGGGRWNTGIKLAKKVGFSFPKRKPVQLRTMFPPDTPRSLVDCIANLLRYNPRYRMTSAQCMEHPYFSEVLPHLQRMPPLPQIPFFNGQPSPGQTPHTQQPPVDVNLNVPSRPLPPSHSHHEPHGAFANGDIRTLPPPEAPTVDSFVGELPTPNGHHPPVSYFPRHSMQRQDSERSYGASALVHQLRELDLPTEDLASYGARRWSEAELMASRQMSLQRYEGSIPDNGSNPSYGNLHSMSAASLERIPSMPQHSHAQHQPHHHPQVPNPNVMAYVQQQAAYQQQMQQQPTMSQSTPNLTPTATPGDPSGGMRPQAQSTMTLPLPNTQQASISKLGPPPVQGGKKKKWGLSSVFGGGGAGGKSGTSLPSVDEHAGSSTSLKRTQSGHYADDRVVSPGQSIDSKSAKKEAERQARELAKAKREAADRAQKERARAVLNKRAQLNETRSTASGEVEYGLGGVNTDGGSVLDLTKATSVVNRSVTSLNGGYPNSQASTSVQSLGSVRSGQSPYLGVDDGMGRHKARKHTEEDDHSSIGRASAKSRSMLSIGTMDSDPGPRRSVHNLWPDPMMQAARRPPSHTYRPSNMSHSAASLESQLASQLQRQATVASASESSLSLGRNAGVAAGAASRASLPIQNFEPGYRVSEPTSPYGHPAGYAVAQGAGTSRQSSRAQLPSIGDWPEMPQDINPMFRVPTSSSDQEHSGGAVDPTNPNGLPPFSAIANMANSQRHLSHHPHQLPPHHPPSH